MIGLSRKFATRLPFYYGYVMMVVAMMVQICSSPGQTFAVSAFKPSLRDGLGLTESQVSLAYMLGTFLAAFPLSAIGPLADRRGLRVVTIATIIAMSLTCLMASQINGFWGLLVVFLLLRFLGQGSLTLLGGNSVAMWFRTKLGRVSAIMSIGTAIAFAWVPQWLTNSIARHGWRQTYVAIAIAVAVGMLPMMLFLFRNRPEDMNQHVDGFDARSNDPTSTAMKETSWTLAEARRTPAFWILAFANAIWAMVGTGVVFHLYTLCDDRGMAAQLPSDLFKVFGLSMLTLQLLGGVLADFLRLNRLLSVGVWILSIGIATLAAGNSEQVFYVFAALFGAGQGLLIAVNSVIWVRYFGREHLGKIRGSVWCLTVAGSGCGPFIMGIARDTTGRFDPAVTAFTVLFLPLAVAAWWATNPSLAAKGRDQGSTAG